jgi:predicted ribosomally synthesized peptide with nif11-like leader
MSIESAKAFYQRITTDEAFQTQLQSATNDERTAIIQQAGYDFTPKEWEAATAEVLEATEVDRELNEAELESVAGGIQMITIYGLPPNLRWPIRRIK